MARDYSSVKAYNGQNTPAPRVDNVAALTQLLQKNMRALTSVLPKHITPERMARISLSTIRRNPKLCQVAPETLLMAIIEASTLGLELDSRGLAYLVPFKNSKTGTYDAQLILGYRGMIELAYRSGKIQTIQASVVGANDKFDYVLGLHPRLEHTPNLQGRGPIIAAYAIAIMKDGAAQFEVMSIDELKKVRKASRAGDSGPWVDWTEQMYIKTVIKRLCKLLPLSPEIQRAVVLDDAVDAGVAQIFGETLEESLVSILAPVTDQTEAPAMPEQIQAQEQDTPAPQKPTQGNLADSSYTFNCPASGKPVNEATCQSCADRTGCPQWEVV